MHDANGEGWNQMTDGGCRAHIYLVYLKTLTEGRLCYAYLNSAQSFGINASIVVVLQHDAQADRS